MPDITKGPFEPGADPTMNPALRSWLPEANEPGCEWPLQNLPICRYLLRSDAEAARRGETAEDGEQPRARLGMAVGAHVLDLDMLIHANALDFGSSDQAEDALGLAHHAAHMGMTNVLMMGGSGYIDGRPTPARMLREAVQAFMLDSAPGGQQKRRLREKALTAMTEIEFAEPCMIPNYTDFYASIHHARTVGSMFRPDNPLLPNYKHVPIGYHGRASSVVVSGTPIVRPNGQTVANPADAKATPVFGPSQRLDYELELGVLIGPGSDFGRSVPIDEAWAQIFGFVLVNDWSARDIQAWEYQPLGPFLSKNFATSISPMIVTRDVMDALRVPGSARGEGDPSPLAYLTPGPDAAGPGHGLNLSLEVLIRSAKMREAGLPAMRVSIGSFREMYWTFAQMIAHHASGGCPLQAGDLIASGTVSGPEAESRGCLLERTWAGNGPDGKPLPRAALKLPSGEERTFLGDGDEVILRGWGEAKVLGGTVRVSLGQCRGEVVKAETR